MDIIILNDKNIAAYEKYIPADIAENIGRTGYYGIAKEQSILVWKQSILTEKGVMLYYKAYDAKQAEILLAEYEDRLTSAGIAKSELYLPENLGIIEREALTGKGYVLCDEEGKTLYTTVSYMSALPIAARCELPDTIVNVGTLNIRQFYQGIRSRKKTAFLEDAEMLSPAWFDQKLSCCVLIEGKVCGYLLVHRLPSGVLRPEMLYIISPAAKRNILDMIRYAIFRAQDLSEGDTGVAIPRFSENVKALTDKLLPGMRGEAVITAGRKLQVKEED